MKCVTWTRLSCWLDGVTLADVNAFVTDSAHRSPIWQRLLLYCLLEWCFLGLLELFGTFAAVLLVTTGENRHAAILPIWYPVLVMHPLSDSGRSKPIMDPEADVWNVFSPICRFCSSVCYWLLVLVLSTCRLPWCTAPVANTRATFLGRGLWKSLLQFLLLFFIFWQVKSLPISACRHSWQSFNNLKLKVTLT